MVRKNVEVAVATPSWEYGTEFCTATTRTCMTRPMPSPVTNMKMATSPYGVWGPSRVSKSRPTARTAVPTMGNTL